MDRAPPCSTARQALGSGSSLPFRVLPTRPSSERVCGVNSMDTKRYSPDVVLFRIESFIVAWLETLVDPNAAELPTFEVMRRSGVDQSAEGEEEAPIQDEGTVSKALSRTGARSYMGILLVLEFCSKLLSSNRTATLREVYYHFKGGPCAFKNQAEAVDAVCNVASLLGVARNELNVFASAKGPVRFRRGQEDGDWVDCTEGSLIKSVWITHAEEIIVESTARYLLVVEKEAIYQRLLDDGLTKELGGVILITGKGFPDVATRACLHSLSKALPTLSIFGICDCNPFGVGICLAYKIGSHRMGQQVGALAVNRLKWIGLRPSQVEQLALPQDVMQRFSKADTSRAAGLLRTTFVKGDPSWQDEITMMSNGKVKCEIEALNALGLHYLSSWLLQAILRRDAI